MPAYFMDSSALVKRYHIETGSAQVAEIFGGSNRLFMSRLGHLEVAAAIARRGRHAGVAANELGDVLASLDRDVDGFFEVIELDSSVIQQALALTRRYALRAADALQLACGLVARADAGQEPFLFVGSDQELNAAATTEGMTVLDPTAAG